MHEPPALFTPSEVYAGDPLNPDLDEPTPAEVVASLTPEQREERLDSLIAQAWQIIDLALDAHLDGRRLAARCVLFSGGNDSTTLAHLMRGYATHAVMANTGIGIEQTRQFVRDTCAAWGLPLIEKHPPTSYRELVLERGFPGPAMHWKMYQRLKERCFRQARSDLITDPRRERVLYIAGRRRQESERREDVPMHERDGSIIFASPFVNWTALDLATYRQRHNVPRNAVSDLLHMSAECLCGAFAHPGELDEIGEWFPEMRAEIEALEAEVRSVGIEEPFCRWGHGKGGTPKSASMCGNCAARWFARDLFTDEANS